MAAAIDGQPRDSSGAISCAGMMAGMTSRDWTLLVVRGFGLYLLAQMLFSVPTLLTLTFSFFSHWTDLFPTDEIIPPVQRMRREFAVQGVGALVRLFVYGSVGLYLLRSPSVLRRLGISLAKAVKTESAIELREAFGVGSETVWKWRRALRVKRTKGDRLRQSEAVQASDPARAKKIAKARLGKPRPQYVIEAMAAARRGKRLSKATRAKMSATHERLGTRPPDGAKLWTARVDRIVRTKSPADAVRLTGRTLVAVHARRTILGVSNRWTPAQDSIVRKKPPGQAAKLTDRTLRADFVRRHRLGINDGKQKGR